MSLAKSANAVQDIIYEIFESQRDIQRSATAVKQPYAKCSAQYCSETLHSSEATWVKGITWASLVLPKALW